MRMISRDCHIMDPDYLSRELRIIFACQTDSRRRRRCGCHSVAVYFAYRSFCLAILGNPASEIKSSMGLLAQCLN